MLVSHETKVPVLAANQVDISVTPLAETPERDKVVDFVLYSNTSVCMFGRADNPKFAAAKTVDDLNKPDITIAYFIGGGEEAWVKQRFPKAKLLGVANSGATAPLEDVMAKRADAAPINRIPYVAMSRKVKGLAVLPKRQQLPGQHGKGAARRHGHRQEPAGVPGMAARGGEVGPRQAGLGRAGSRGDDEVSGGAKPSWPR